jgi:hypothetical protein
MPLVEKFVGGVAILLYYCMAGSKLIEIIKVTKVTQPRSHYLVKVTSSHVCRAKVTSSKVKGHVGNGAR